MSDPYTEAKIARASIWRAARGVADALLDHSMTVEEAEEQLGIAKREFAQRRSDTGDELYPAKVREPDPRNELGILDPAVDEFVFPSFAYACDVEGVRFLVINDPEINCSGWRIHMRAGEFITEADFLELPVHPEGPRVHLLGDGVGSRAWMVEADWGMTAVAVTLPDGTCHAVPALSSRTSRRGSESSISAREMRHIVPLDRENRWSDLLAVLIEADPASAAELLGLSDRSRQVRVRREVALSVKDRIDLMLDEEIMTPTAVEVKVLSGLGPQQLRRYGELTREVDHHILIFPERMPTATAGTGWRGVTWEELLGAFTTSEKTWVAETAHAWLAHLQGAMPRVDAHTRWNALAGGDDFALSLRARMSWVYGRLRPPAPIEHDLVLSGAGRSAVARMYLPAAVPGYKVIVEAEEKLPVRGWRKISGPAAGAILGPSIKVCLIQCDVDTSANFDWDYLLALWPLMKAGRQDWVTTPAKPKLHDRANWQGMIAKGGPPYLGIGFGEAEAKRSGACMFGARFQLPANVELGGVVDALHETAALMLDMARLKPPTFGGNA